MLPSSSVPETPQPSKPPALTVQVRSPAGTTASPVSPPTSPSTPSRTANFAFLPLLPVQEPQESAPVAPSAPPPSNRFNMTFLPLGVEVLEPEPMSSAQPPEPTQDASTPTHSPPPSSTPSLDASDTDTDTDAESDAPSTVASSLPSPPCSDEPEHDSSDPGYFNVPASAYSSQRMPTSDPGQTPPLSALYPTSPPSDPDATPVENALGSAKTHALRALPSPALRHAQHIAGPPVGLGVQMDREREREKPPMTKRMFTAVRTQLHASVSADVGGQVRWVDVEEQSPDGVLRPSLSRREVA
ncbi:hypothetical protein B0H21DRAFT_740643 [Amylocystis lapponica]|nr:hypothetical protein B0H21DRAFT_740643 [Amylocystis lapponica]